MLVLAIDPGYERIGIAVIEKDAKWKDILIYSDCFKTDSKDKFENRLLQVGEEIARLIEEYSPDALAIEKLFFNTNQKTAMNVAEVRGALIYIGKASKLTLFEYTPLQIKNAVTGYGRSTKEQIAKMVPNLIKINKEIEYDDEYDAIAIGLTCLASER